MAVIREEKKAAVQYVKDCVEASTVYFTDFRGLSVSEMTDLRKELRQAGSSLKVVKNTFIKVALSDLGVAISDGMFEGNTAIVTTTGEPSRAAKVLLAFLKDREEIEVKGGVLDRDVIDKGAVKDLSRLPSQEELLAKLVSILNSPVTGLVQVLSSPTRGVVYTLKSISEKQEG